MDLRPTVDQREIVGVFADVYGEHCTPDHVRAAESGSTPGHDQALWQRLLDLGALDMAAAGEEGLRLLDLALVAEQHGRFVAPTPMIEAQVATRLLGRLGAGPDPACTIAVRPAYDGTAGLVPAGAVLERAIVLVGDRVCLVELDGRRTPVANLGSLPLADVDVAGDLTVLGTGREAVAELANAVDEWRTLTAAALAGLATRVLEIGVEYVKERRAFGQPVGQFQAVQHRLADRATEADGAELLARKAAWAADHERDRFATLASMALAFNAETATAASHDALHFHGGYGFMLEYAAQLYYRRARSWGAVLESPAEGYRRAAGEQLATAGVA